VDLYIDSTTHLHGLVLSQSSTGATFYVTIRRCILHRSNASRKIFSLLFTVFLFFFSFSYFPSSPPSSLSFHFFSSSTSKFSSSIPPSSCPLPPLINFSFLRLIFVPYLPVFLRFLYFSFFSSTLYFRTKFPLLWFLYSLSILPSYSLFFRPFFPSLFSPYSFLFLFSLLYFSTSATTLPSLIRYNFLLLVTCNILLSFLLILLLLKCLHLPLLSLEYPVTLNCAFRF
jgi:hypothetical protein